MTHRIVGSGLFAVAAGGLAVACGGSGAWEPTSGSAAGTASAAELAPPPRPSRHHMDVVAGNLAGTHAGFAEFGACVDGPGCAGTGAGTYFVAEFYTPEVTDAAPPCTITSVGACTSYVCTNPGQALDTFHGAGTLTISGGAIGTQLLTTNKRQQFFYQWSAPGEDFTAGDTLTVSGSGATVPAFGPHSVVAPGFATLTSPAPSTRGVFHVDTARPLHVAWSGGAAGQKFNVAGYASSSTETAQFDCAWDATRGSASVPASVLAPLAGMTGGSLTWDQYASTTFKAGSYTTYLDVSPYGTGNANFK